MDNQEKARAYLGTAQLPARINGESVRKGTVEAVRYASGEIVFQGGSFHESSAFYASTPRGEAVTESGMLDADMLVSQALAQQSETAWVPESPVVYHGQNEQIISVENLKKKAFSVLQNLKNQQYDTRVQIIGRTHRQWVEGTAGMHVSDAASCELTELKSNGISLMSMDEDLAPLIGEMARRQSFLRLPEADVKSGIIPVVWSPDAFNDVIIAFWKLFRASDYAEGHSVMSGRLGTKIASEVFSLADQAGTGYISRIDSEGTVGTDICLIEEGVLSDLLATRRDASVTMPKGSAGRTGSLVKGYSIQAVPRHLTVKKGAFRTEELIRACGDGLYVYDVFDPFHALDTASGQFSFPCAAARIENGKLTGRTKDVLIEGNVCECLQSIVSVGTDTLISPLPIMETYLCESPAVFMDALSIRVTS